MRLIIKESNSNNEGQQLYLHYDGKEWVEKWEKKVIAFSMEMENHLQEIEPIRNQVLAGQLSPLAYHIEAKIFNIKLLSSYTGISKRHIKKHLIPKNFNQLDEETLKKYAATLGISVEELKTV
ncbi:MAG: hypothetical protein LBH91_04625 [Prevotellaceae bacterium]|jgi:hypothetical protein|nr:hypothetical protein [Prevotellaceae bacterium]